MIGLSIPWRPINAVYPMTRSAMFNVLPNIGPTSVHRDLRNYGPVESRGFLLLSFWSYCAKGSEEKYGDISPVDA